MFNLSVIFKLTILVMLSAIIGGCTQSQNSVDTALTPQATQQTPSVEANSLDQTDQANAAQNVTEAQTSSGLANEAASQTQVAAVDAANALTFLPLEGAPTDQVTKLSKQLKRSASANGLTVFPPTQTGAPYQVKGYFSALNDGSGTLLVYVWDVLDPSGKRLHRINGQERSGTSKTNPWLAITEKELSRVADRTTASLKSWVDNRKS